MADEPDLRPGDTGAYVTYLKQLLNYWDPAAQLDDTNDQWPEVRGSELGDVLWRFQSSRGLPNIGYCDRATWDALLGEGETQGAEGEPGEGTALAEPVWMEIDDGIEISRAGVWRWWAGNPAQPARTDAQTIKYSVLRPDGTEAEGGERAFPELTGTVGPGEYAIIDHDALGSNLLPGQGCTIRVIVNPDTAVESSREFKFDIDENFHWNSTGA